MVSIPINHRSLGANLIDDSLVEIRVWAPFAKQVEVVLLDQESQKIPLASGPFGYWHAESSELKEGDLYQISVDGILRPDPASLSQPQGVHGPSAIVKLAGYSWTDQDWKGLDPESAIIYELHLGTFSPEGNFQGAMHRLDDLKELGINTIEVMPVAQFPGNRNWGYDGVHPFAVQDSYGGARGLQEFVNACHEREIAVLLDVVYNHLGPEGNYLADFGPYFTDKYNTPWGKAVNMDDAYCDGVRQYFIENALMWMRDFHLDGLRLDAVHAIKDTGAKHFLQELRECVDRLSEHTGRSYFLLAECDLNDVRYLKSPEEGGYGMHAQWCDEFHHALHALVTGETRGYYEDFGELQHLDKSYRSAYVYDGRYSEHRHKMFGSSTEGRPGHQFVVFAQNHDQTGNRMLGERLSQLVSYEMQKLIAGAVLIAPFVPLLFMGEEYGETQPFQYFVSHTDEHLVELVRQGRSREFEAFQDQGETPDPQAEATFMRSKLQWNFASNPSALALRSFYQTLIKLRREHPVFAQLNRENLETELIEEHKALILYRWQGEHRACCLLNFEQNPISVKLLGEETKHYKKLLDSATEGWKGPGSQAPQTLDQGQEILLSPESITIYANSHV